jgi:hypothetical protein
MKCFLTVASVAKEDELGDAERLHDCEELMVIDTFM